jgi:peroxiredoxin
VQKSTFKVKVLFFLFLNLVCTIGTLIAQNAEDKSYLAGKAKCKAELEALQKERPNDLIFRGPECMVGYYLPDFEFKSIDNKIINPAYLKGKISVINFWFMACPPCLAEIPGFKNLVDKYGTDRFNFIAIGQDSREEIEAYIKNHPWPFLHVADAKDLARNSFNLGWGYPTTFIVDENGVIVSAFCGGKSDQRAVEEIENRISPFLDAFLSRK